MTPLHWRVHVQKQVGKFEKFKSLSSRRCVARKVRQLWQNVLANEGAQTSWHPLVGIPADENGMPASPCEAQQSQGRGRACGPGLVLLELLLWRNRSGKRPFAVQHSLFFSHRR